MEKTYFHRLFRMPYFIFRRPFLLIKLDLEEVVGLKKRKPGYGDCSPNGPINLATHLAVEILFFAVGEAYAISVMVGISQVSVFNSIDAMVDGATAFGCRSSWTI